MVACLLTGVIEAAPIINSQPAATAVAPGANAVLRISATGENPSYQWFSGVAGDTAVPVPGATGAVLISPIVRTDASFWVRVTDASGSADSQAAAVTLGAPDQTRLFEITGGAPTPTLISTRVTQSSASPGSLMFIRDNGELWARGENFYGNLGTGNFGTLRSPEKITTQVEQVSAGQLHTLFIKSDQTLWGMGYNYYGALGDGSSSDRSSPGLVMQSVLQASAGPYFSLFVKTDGSLWSTGYNASGQLGDGTLTTRLAPVHVADSVTMACAGGTHSLFLKSDGTLWAMGNNNYGQLGDGTTTGRSTPIQIASGVATLAAGSNCSFFIKTDGSLWGSGDNNYGQLGTDNPVNVLSPVKIAQGVASVAVGYDHTLIIKTDKTLWAMGYNYSQQFTDNPNNPQPTPIQIQGPSAVSAITAGNNITFFQDLHPAIDTQPADTGLLAGTTASFSVTASGSGPISYQWYSGSSGDVANPWPGATGAAFQTPPLTGTANYWVRVTTPYGSADSRTVSAVVVTQPVITSNPVPPSVSVGENASMSISASGGMLVYQWYQGASGDTSTPIAGATGPLLVTSQLTEGKSFWVKISNAAGSVDSATVPVTVTPPVPGYLLSVGAMAYDPTGTTGFFSLPVPSPIDTGISKVSSSSNHTLIVRTDGSLWIRKSTSPTPAQLAPAVTWIASGASSSVFVKTDSTLWTVDGSGVPVQVTSGVSMAWISSNALYYLRTNGVLYTKPSSTGTERMISPGVIAAAAGGSHLLFIKTDGTLWGSGFSDRGALGRPSYEITEPIQLSSGVAKVAAGQGTSYFIKTDGTLWAMGANDFGQLGLGTSTDEFSYPLAIASGVSDIAANTSASHAMFIKNDGSLWSMGLNSSGQLGDGTSAQRSIPVLTARQVSQVAVGPNFTQFVTTDGTLWGMGSNGGKLLGSPLPPAESSPSQMADGVIAISAGKSHNLIVKADGTLWAWGANTYGQLGDGTQISRPLPVLIAIGVVKASAGANHSLFIKTDGTLWGMGSNSYAQLGAASTTNRLTPVQLASDVTSVHAGTYHSLFIKSDASLWAMGDNSFGQRGDISGLSSRSPVQISTNVVAAAAGYFHTLFLKSDGSLWATGQNQSGQLGDGTTITRYWPVQVSSGVSRIAAGQYHSQFLKSDGSLWAMGANDDGQLGDGTTESRSNPVPIATGVTNFSAGASFSNFIKSDGTLWSTGENGTYQLGDGTNISHSTPVQVASNIIAASAGDTHALWLTTTAGSTYTAIGNQPVSVNVVANGTATLSVTAIGSGTLGYQWYSGFSGDTTTPLAGANSASFTTPPVSASTNYWVRVSSESGTADSRTARVSVLNAPTIIAQPVLAASLPGGGVKLTVAASSNATSYQWYSSASQFPISGGTTATLFTLPVKATTQFWVKVTNSSGSVQSQSVSVSPSKSVIPSNLRVAGASYSSSLTLKFDSTTAVSTSANHTLLLDTGGNLWAFGNNPSGQFGNGTFANSTTPVRVVVQTVTAAAAGANHSLFVKFDNTLWAMGSNSYGQLGNNGTEISNVPVQIATGASTPVAGSRHSLFIKTDGTLWAMGDNSNGQLGDGSTVLRRAPVKVIVPTGQIPATVVMAAAGYDHSLFLKSDGTLWGMGSNAYGQIGSFKSSNAAVPFKIADGVVSIAAGDYHSLYLSADGTLRAIGRNNYGALGYGATDNDWRNAHFPTAYEISYSPKITAANVTGLAAGTSHSLWTKADNTLWTVGYNNGGQLCNGLPSSPKPQTKFVNLKSGSVWFAAAGGNNSALITDSRTTQPPSIAVHPVSRYVNSGGTVTFSVSATGTGLSYQWYSGPSGNTSQPIPGNSTSYTTPPLLSDTQVWVRVSNAYGYTDSNAAIAIIGASPSDYQTWASQIDAPDNTPTADPDNDSRSNLLEYATGSSPIQSDSSPLIDITADPAIPKVDFTLQLRSDQNLRYTCQLTSDFVTLRNIPLEFFNGQWTINDPLLHVSAADPGPDNLWTLTLRHSTTPEKLFIKLIVEK